MFWRYARDVFYDVPWGAPPVRIIDIINVRIVFVVRATLGPEGWRISNTLTRTLAAIFMFESMGKSKISHFTPRQTAFSFTRAAMTKARSGRGGKKTQKQNDKNLARTRASFHEQAEARQAEKKRKAEAQQEHEAKKATRGTAGTRTHPCRLARTK